MGTSLFALFKFLKFFNQIPVGAAGPLPFLIKKFPAVICCLETGNDMGNAGQFKIALQIFPGRFPVQDKTSPALAKGHCIL